MRSSCFCFHFAAGAAVLNGVRRYVFNEVDDDESV